MAIGLGTLLNGMNPEDMARLFGKAPMGAPQGFAGTSGAVQEEAPTSAPLSLRVKPSLAQPEAQPPASPPAQAPALSTMTMPMPPRRPVEFSTSDSAPLSPADMPAPNAVPTSGNFPERAAPSAPPKPASEDGGIDFGGALKRFTDRGGGDLLVGLGTGLMSTRGFGPGLAAGFQNAQRAEAQRAATGLANAELGLKQRKLAQETAALTGNAGIIKRAYPNLSDAEAISAGSNSGQVSEALKILRDPSHGTGVSRVTVGGNIYELKPGERPSAATLVGSAEASPAQVEERAAASARGTAAGKPEETYALVPETERVSLGLPAGSYQRDSKGKVSAVNPSGTSVNIGAPEKEQDKIVGKGLGEYQVKLATDGRNAASTLNTLALMEQAMKKPGFYSGVGANAFKQVNQFLGALGVKDASSASAAEVFDAFSNKVVLDGLGGSLGPGISNTDRDYISRTAPTLQQSEAGNRELIRTARLMAQRQQDIAKMARDYAGRNSGRLDHGFDQELADFALRNPLFPQAAEGGAAATPSPGSAQGATQAAPSRATLEAEARRRGLMK